MTLIVGFSGFAGVGKDKAGEALAALGWERKSFADPLKHSCSIATGIPFEVFNDPDKKNDFEYGVYGHTPREVLQLMGTEGWRNLIHADVWIDAFLRYAKTPGLKIPGVYSCDVRFINEANAILAAGGTLIHIDRPGKEAPEFLHQSELEVPEVRKLAHYVLHNKSTVEELHDMVRWAVSGTGV